MSVGAHKIPISFSTGFESGLVDWKLRWDYILNANCDVYNYYSGSIGLHLDCVVNSQEIVKKYLSHNPMYLRVFSKWQGYDGAFGSYYCDSHSIISSDGTLLGGLRLAVRSIPFPETWWGVFWIDNDSYSIYWIGPRDTGWHRVEFGVKTGSGNGEFKFWWDGTLKVNQSSLNNANHGTPGGILFQAIIDGSFRVWFDVDDVAVSNERVGIAGYPAPREKGLYDSMTMRDSRISSTFLKVLKKVVYLLARNPNMAYRVLITLPQKLENGKIRIPVRLKGED